MLGPEAKLKRPDTIIPAMLYGTQTRTSPERVKLSSLAVEAGITKKAFSKTALIATATARE